MFIFVTTLEEDFGKVDMYIGTGIMLSKDCLQIELSLDRVSKIPPASNRTVSIAVVLRVLGTTLKGAAPIEESAQVKIMRTSFFLFYRSIGTYLTCK